MAENTASSIRLSGLLSPASIGLSLASSRRDDVLRELVAKVPEISGNLEAQERLFRALLEREGLHSTGIGEGVAIPHARNALPGLLKQPVIVFGRHAQGIEFGALDGAPVKLFFLLVAVNVSQHLYILARISRLLRQPSLRHGLLTAESASQVLDLVREAEGLLP